MARLKRAKKFSKGIVSVILIVCLLTVSMMTAFASGSSVFNKDASKYKFYTEFFTNGTNTTTAGIKRQTILTTYLFEGETVYFGSSVKGSKLDINDAVQSTVTGADIVVTSPDGISKAFPKDDNDENPPSDKGYISTRAQEQAGPNTLTTGGYTPYSFTAVRQGEYTFKFHSADGSSVNPSAKKNSVATVTNQNNGAVAYWDITVTDSNKKIKTGRTYTNYLSLNTGTNEISSNLDVYVLTTDGFIYNVKLNDVDPYGFIFFANNQGLTTTDFTPSSIYHSLRSADNSLNLSKTGVTYHEPNAANNALEETYLIFFEKPSSDLQNILYNEPETPKPVSNIRFHGYTDGKAYYGQGGYFTLRTEHSSSVALTVDFTKQIALWLASDDEKVKQACQTYLDNGGSCVVQINGAVTDGENTFFWDGSDTNEIPVPVGTYNDENSIKITATPKAGEIHFPFLDVENLNNGITVERVNDIDGVQQPAGKYDLYYNNNPLIYCSIDGTNKCPSSKGLVTLADGTKTYDMGSTFRNFSGLACTGTYNTQTKSIDYEPVNTSTTPNVMKYTAKSGDQTLIDCWTYYSSMVETVSTLKSNFEIVEETEKSANVFGKVFYDQIYTAGTPATYNAPDGDYFIDMMDVFITNKDTGDEYVCKTNSRGIYYFFGLPYGTYELRTDLSQYYKDIFTNTSNNDGNLGRPNQTIVINDSTVANNGSVNFTAADVGYQITDKQLTNVFINKNWAANTSPAEKIRVKLYTYIDGESVFTGRQAYLDKNCNWSTIFKDLPDSYTYYVTEEYLSTTGDYVLIGKSSDVHSEDVDVASDSVTNNGFTANFDYTIHGTSIIFDITNAVQDNYTVVFHENLYGTSTSTTKNDIYKTFRPTDTDVTTNNKLNADNTISSFYDIPESYNNNKVFAGWYYEPEFSNTTNSLKWNTDAFSGKADTSLPYAMDSNHTYHIYAHWLNTGTVSKNASGTAEEEIAETAKRNKQNPYNTIDNKVTGQNFYKGFDLAGVQIKVSSYDPNYPEMQYGTVKCNDGLRFLNVLSENFMADVNGLFDGKAYKGYTDAEMEYGDVVAKESKAKDRAGEDVNYELEYKGTNVNGVDTTSNFDYVQNAVCTSSVPIYTTKEVLNSKTNIIDHRNYTGYRLYTTVITYSNAQTTAAVADAQQSNIVSRAYIRYVDANGLLRTHYNNYSGTTLFGGCSTSYSYVKQLSGNQVGIK